MSVTKSAIRTLSAPLADAAAVNTVMNTLISTNPFECISYEVGGVTIEPVTKIRENSEPASSARMMMALEIRRFPRAADTVERFIPGQPNNRIAHQDH
jgi:hypothetical protein